MLPQLLVRAGAELALKHYDAAADAYRAALVIAPDLTLARLQVMRIMLFENDPTAATAVLTEGLSRQPQNFALMQAMLAVETKTSGLDSALASADRMAKQTPVALPLRGDLLFEAKRYDDAANAYAAAAKASPSTALVLRQAAALDAAGHRDQSAEVLRGWLKQFPGDTETAMNLADRDIAAMKLPEAKTILTDVITRQPSNVAALNNLAWVNQQSKDPQARSLAERAYMLAPSPQTADTLGYIFATQGRGAGFGRIAAAPSEPPAPGRPKREVPPSRRPQGRRSGPRRRSRF